MSCSELRRTGIDPLSNVWSLDIYGDPSASGFDIGVGSIARQLDSSVPGALWAKTGTAITAWTALFFGPNRAIVVTDLPDLSATINAQVVDAVTNPFTTPPGLTTPDDFKFGLKAGLGSL